MDSDHIMTIEAGGESVTMTNKEFNRAADNLRHFKVPDDHEFTDLGSEFIDDTRFDDIAAEFIDAYDDFKEIANAKILFLWKQKGGKSGGKLTLGKCQKPSGLLAHYANADFVIWIAADHCRDYRFNTHQIRAMIFHEMCHADYDPETGCFVMRGHDFEGYRREIEEFGLWRADAIGMAKAFAGEQPGLFEAAKA